MRSRGYPPTLADAVCDARDVSERIHDDEPDTSGPVVTSLLEAECPQWAQSPIEYLKTSGTDNAMWRISVDDGPDMVIRLPRRPGAAAGVLHEAVVLQQIEQTSIGSTVNTPKLRHVGEPHDVFPHHWTVLEWIDGSDAWTLRHDMDGRLLDALATDLADAVNMIGTVAIDDVRRRSPGSRGGPLLALLERLEGWLQSAEWNAAALLDVAAVRRLAAEALEVVDEPVIEGFVHGDLIPGNLLVDEGRLTAIIDWGGAGWGDTAQDLAPAWAVLTSFERSAFKEAVGADDAAWIRGRTFELEHAVGGVLYYVPKQHPLGDVMSRTLERILTSP
jgi:aminoglycoside phosphotransferase (APT) family kinase protein